MKTPLLKIIETALTEAVQMENTDRPTGKSHCKDNSTEKDSSLEPRRGGHLDLLLEFCGIWN